MARYIFTPARRAALKRAQAKSAAKRAGKKSAKLQKYGPSKGKRTRAQQQQRDARTIKRVTNTAAALYLGAYVAANVVAREEQIKKQYGNKANYKLHRNDYKKARKQQRRAATRQATAAATRPIRKQVVKRRVAKQKSRLVGANFAAGGLNRNGTVKGGRVQSERVKPMKAISGRRV